MLETIREQVAAISVTEWIGVVTGLAAVWCSIKEKLAAWPLFIVCYLSYAFLSWEARLLPSIAMNVTFIGLSTYGWLRWSRKATTSNIDESIRQVPQSAWLFVTPICLISTLVFGTLFGRYGAYLPYVDAFAASLALAAQWMLSRRYFETWVLWIISDLVYIALWAAQGYWPTVGLFGIFVILAIKGLKDWRPLLQQSPAQRH